MTERKRLRDIELLTQSIAHWKRMKAHPKSCNEEPSYRHCSLCYEYLHDPCVGCPVADHTGKSGCKGTPYGTAVAAWMSVIVAEYVDKSLTTRATLLENWTKAAQEEIDFLEMLKTKLEHQSPTP